MAAFDVLEAFVVKRIGTPLTDLTIFIARLIQQRTAPESDDSFMG
jgi:hypothetical protein